MNPRDRVYVAGRGYGTVVRVSDGGWSILVRLDGQGPQWFHPSDVALAQVNL